MTEGDLQGLHPRPEPPWGAKVIALHEAFELRGIAYAFGGAIALNYHREPRSTLDIDINVFLPPERDAEVIAVLRDLYAFDDDAKVRADLSAHAQARTLWGATYIDLFFTNTDLHHSMARRVERQPFGEAEVSVLAIEDLLICKILFDRPKDWLDVEAVAQTREGELDGVYIREWLRRFLPDDDARHARLARVMDDARRA